MKLLRMLSHHIVRHRYGATLWTFLAAAALTGTVCVFFMWAFEFVLHHRLDAGRIGVWWWVTTPVLFVVAVELIRRFAPYADGTGIPQVIFAATHFTEATQQQLQPLISTRTMVVKMLALLLGVWAGASTGREGPTVHIAACVAFSVIFAVRRLTGLNLDLRSAIIAGGAAGLAAAFNTPLAGVTFAIEELSVGEFAAIKEFVLMAIIIAGITAKSLTGEYAYFGKLASPTELRFTTVLAVTAAAGLAGAAFSSLLIIGKGLLSRVAHGLGRSAVAVVFALGLLMVASVSQANVLGPGNQAAQLLIGGRYDQWVPLFPLEKMAATLFTYWSGIAGGIFAPCLSMGAAIGASIGHWSGAATAGCAMLGMAAFLSGAIQAPITAFVIIFEMTGQHQMLLPIMLASLLASMAARLCGAKHFYQTMAEQYNVLLPHAAARFHS